MDMDKDVVDDVNALLKLGVGDAYRLEHIKQSYMQNKTVWITDSNYLQKLKDKYLARQAEEIPQEEEEEDGRIHCWKCGRKINLDANFCMACGSALFEVGTEAQRVERPAVPEDAGKKGRSLKIPILICIPLVIVLALGGGYYAGAFDAYLDSQTVDTLAPDAKPADAPDAKIADAPDAKPADPSDPASKCGPGLVLDKGTNSCVLAPADNSKCGPGTIYDEDSNSCVLG
ncbi:MAG: zinc-ribbon domain-containing protein [Nitrosopumilus sp. H13]|nr:MAG: zinc-ribbon domain-containing protein [Nitrosopumilus sp. H13]